MRMARMPIAVVMQRRTIRHKWAGDAWSAAGVVPDPGGLAPVTPLGRSEDGESYLVSGLHLDIYPDEDDGYFENWVAPEPKVFVMWRLQDQRAMPVAASVSYGEGTRMLDSGEPVDGVAMPREIHAWLAQYLQEHYRPRERRGREHG
ncbi:DUF3305 domain-containing protein [Noviherbaspirillum sp.]|uniref:DUF3305 domain-containing protein n=1 Tax=Noviherbaspirillum sp. TaxID=1926288 RepID=UPI002B486D60|nr:DUF3305 domain-containing protein [Noviherbaspirillum sp.]HJV80947.1 DUF3305 domain-containing protein [Noviherbaspirillum sp.]